MMLRVQSCSMPVMGADKENLDSGKKITEENQERSFFTYITPCYNKTFLFFILQKDF